MLICIQERMPTVYHLRSELIHNEAAHDVRLVYLAVLNLFKHRGHFLNASLSTKSEDTGFRDTKTIYDEIRSELQEFYDIMLPATIDYEALEDILSDRNYSRTKKSESIVAMLQLTKKEKQASAISLRALLIHMGLKHIIYYLNDPICEY